MLVFHDRILALERPNGGAVQQKGGAAPTKKRKA
jgi:hypothetical protein